MAIHMYTYIYISHTQKRFRFHVGLVIITVCSNLMGFVTFRHYCFLIVKNIPFARGILYADIVDSNLTL